MKFEIKGLNAAGDREEMLALLQGISKEGSRECVTQLCQCTGVGGHSLLHPCFPHDPHLSAPGGPALHSSTLGNLSLKDRSGHLSSEGRGMPLRCAQSRLPDPTSSSLASSSASPVTLASSPFSD